MEFNPDKHEVHPNGATIRCKACNKYRDRCICDKVKGEKDGLCNRSVCQSPLNVKYYNHSTRKYYCPCCAHTLNECNYSDAQRIWGHDLCTLED